ncbi:MAG TPA: hypothetical protein PKW57_02975, partial [Anaerolineaceae bacterium]|nr:hypothetical protein [Anaerolineaceae bacterium]
MAAPLHPTYVLWLSWVSLLRRCTQPTNSARKQPRQFFVIARHEAISLLTHRHTGRLPHRFARITE